MKEKLITVLEVQGYIEKGKEPRISILADRIIADCIGHDLLDKEDSQILKCPQKVKVQARVFMEEIS